MGALELHENGIKRIRKIQKRKQKGSFMAELCFFQISVLTNFDFLYDDEAEDVSWGPEYEDRRLSYCSLDVGSLDRDMKSNLQTLECLSGSEQDLTPHDSSDDDDEVLFNIGKGHFLFEVF